VYIGGATFAAYCASQAEKPAFCTKSIIKSVILSCATITGLFGSSLLWTGHFVYLANYGPNKGLYNSTFFTFFQFTGIAAQIFNYLYYTFSPDIKAYFAIFLVVGSIGCTCLFFLPNTKSVTESSLGSKSEKITANLNSLQSVDDKQIEESLNSLDVKDQSLQNKKPKQTPSVKDTVMDVLREFKNPEMIKLMPTLILSGLMQGFLSSV
jgi:hypothetical protein